MSTQNSGNERIINEKNVLKIFSSLINTLFEFRNLHVENIIFYVL